jgi:hypothetical protein
MQDAALLDTMAEFATLIIEKYPDQAMVTDPCAQGHVQVRQLATIWPYWTGAWWGKIFGRDIYILPFMWQLFPLNE